MSSTQIIGAETSSTPPIIVFGAFDRHNFGDLLFPHIAAALLQGEQIIFAGLLERDMRGCGGHLVKALPSLAQCLRDRPVRILHAGGELLTCSAWEAAVMLLSSDNAKKAVFHYGKDLQARERWAHALLGVPDHAPYTISRLLFPHALAVVYNAVGGVDLSAQPLALREEIVHKLGRADDVSVRDQHTLASLRMEGINARLLPDSAVMVAELFGTRIEQRSCHGEVAQIRAAMPHGYLAVQFSADFGRQSILRTLAAQLERIATMHRCGIVLFRAGAAPWHDEIECYRRLAAQMSEVPVRIFRSLDVWDICALIAHSQAYCGSSLHGRIVALAFQRPRINLFHPDQPIGLPTKHESFVQTWEDDTMPGLVAIDSLEQGLHGALHADPCGLKAKAAELCTHYRHGFGVMHQRLMVGTT